MNHDALIYIGLTPLGIRPATALTEFANLKDGQTGISGFWTEFLHGEAIFVTGDIQ